VTADRRLLALIGGRLVVGGGALLAPRLTGRVFGIDPDQNPAAPYVGRLFGVRAVLMGLSLAASTGDEREHQLRGGVAVDIVDALAAIAALRTGGLDARAGAAAFAAAVAEAALGVRLLSTRGCVAQRQ
jgi:hypothetical protein